MQVPRLIGQDDNQVVAKVDQQLGAVQPARRAVLLRSLHQRPDLHRGQPAELSQSRRCSRACERRTSSASWTRTLSNTSLNELRVGYNRMHARRFPPTNNVPSMQELGVRLPIYPTLAVDFGDQRQRILQHRRQPRGLVRPQRPRAERPVHDGQGQAQHPGRRRSAELHRGDRQPVPARGTLHLRRQPHRPPDCRLPARLRPDLRPGHRRVQGLQRVVRVAVRSGRFQGVVEAHAEPGSALREHAAVARDRSAASNTSRSRTTTTTCARPMFPPAPRGETFRGDPGVPYDGTDAKSNNFGPRVGLCVGPDRRRQDQPSRRRRHVLRPAPRRRIGQRRGECGAVEPSPVRDQTDRARSPIRIAAAPISTSSPTGRSGRSRRRSRRRC